MVSELYSKMCEICNMFLWLYSVRGSDRKRVTINSFFSPTYKMLQISAFPLLHTIFKYVNDLRNENFYFSVTQLGFSLQLKPKIKKVAPCVR